MRLPYSLPELIIQLAQNSVFNLSIGEDQVHQPFAGHSSRSLIVTQVVILALNHVKEQLDTFTGQYG